MKPNVSVFITLLVFLATPAIGGTESKEDPNRCECWFDGYDTYPQTEGSPGGTKDECDLRGMKIEWDDGSKAHKAGDSRKCPFHK